MILTHDTVSSSYRSSKQKSVNNNRNRCLSCLLSRKLFKTILGILFVMLVTTPMEEFKEMSNFAWEIKQSFGEQMMNENDDINENAYALEEGDYTQNLRHSSEHNEEIYEKEESNNDIEYESSESSPINEEIDSTEKIPFEEMNNIPDSSSMENGGSSLIDMGERTTITREDMQDGENRIPDSSLMENGGSSLIDMGERTTITREDMQDGENRLPDSSLMENGASSLTDIGERTTITREDMRDGENRFELDTTPSIEKDENTTRSYTDFGENKENMEVLLQPMESQVESEAVKDEKMLHKVMQQMEGKMKNMLDDYVKKGKIEDASQLVTIEKDLSKEFKQQAEKN